MLGGGAHSIPVVFAYKHAWKVPEFGHVECLKDLTLVACTITIKSEHSGGLLEVFYGKGNASVDGNLGTNNTMAPPKKLSVKMCIEPSFPLDMPI